LVEALEKLVHEIYDYDEARQWVAASTLDWCLDLLARASEILAKAKGDPQ